MAISFLIQSQGHFQGSGVRFHSLANHLADQSLGLFDRQLPVGGFDLGPCAEHDRGGQVKESVKKSFVMWRSKLELNSVAQK